MKNIKSHQNRNSGFTLMETIISVTVLFMLMGFVLHQLNKAQSGYKVEGQKVDLTQQQREFIDQFTRDLHQAGYPSPSSSGIPPGVNGLDLSIPQIAAGITAISPTSITEEGDLDNSGQIQVVTYSLNPAGPAPCPCIQRTVSIKGGGGAPATYIEVQNVLVPGPQGIFLSYDVNGNPQPGLTVALAAGDTTKSGSYATLHGIKGVRVGFSLQGTTNELNGVTPVEVTMTGMARIPNN